MTRLGIGALAALVVACHGAPASKAASADANPISADTAVRSAAKFTQDFYDWYRGQGDRMDLALKDRRAAFEPTLLAALDADGAAQDRHPGEIVGLDWDPFTASQDPCDPYHVAGAAWHGDTVNVPVWHGCKDEAPASKPDVIAQVMRTPTGWVFVDFRHADNKGGLRQDLAELQRGRDSTASASRK